MAQGLEKNSKIGKKSVNNFQLREELGTGGFGSVYFAVKGTHLISSSV
jgi:hypothetical protein